MFWVISVYFNIRNTLPKFCPFLLGHPVYVYELRVGRTRWRIHTGEENVSCDWENGIVLAKRYVISIKMEHPVSEISCHTALKVTKPPVTFCLLCTAQCGTRDMLAEPLD